MAGMTMAVIDPHGNIIHQWDTTQLARDTITRLTVEKVEETRGRLGRTKTKITHPTVEEALNWAIDQQLLTVARM